MPSIGYKERDKMTPREQIIQASIEFSRNSKARRLRCRNFEKGAEYGYNLALEKIYGILDEIDFEQSYLDSENLFDKEKFIDNLKKAMIL